MSKSNMSKIIKNTKTWTNKHSPSILTGFGVAGMVTTTVLAVKATPKASYLLEQSKNEKGEDLTVIETIKVAWKPYIPAAISGTVSIACIIGANSVHSKRNTALAAAYKISETAFSEYREKVVETIGEKKEKTVRDKVAKKKVEEKPVSKNQVIITNTGNTLCFDSISGRYFRSDIDKLRKAENDLNRRMIQREDYISLTQFYEEIGLPSTSISDELGWNVDNGLIELYFSSQLAEDGTPCVVIQYDTMPAYGFSSYR